MRKRLDTKSLTGPEARRFYAITILVVIAGMFAGQALNWIMS